MEPILNTLDYNAVKVLFYALHVVFGVVNRGSLTFDQCSLEGTLVIYKTNNYPFYVMLILSSDDVALFQPILRGHQLLKGKARVHYYHKRKRENAYSIQFDDQATCDRYSEIFEEIIENQKVVIVVKIPIDN